MQVPLLIEPQPVSRWLRTRRHRPVAGASSTCAQEYWRPSQV